MRESKSKSQRREFLGALAAAPLLLALPSCAVNAQPPAEPSQASAGTPTKKGSSSSVASEENWPLFRGDVLASGVAKTTVADAPELLWKMDVKNGAFEATPIIVDGVVY